MVISRLGFISVIVLVSDAGAVLSLAESSKHVTLEGIGSVISTVVMK